MPIVRRARRLRRPGVIKRIPRNRARGPLDFDSSRGRFREQQAALLRRRGYTRQGLFEMQLAVRIKASYTKKKRRVGARRLDRHRLPAVGMVAIFRIGDS